MMDPNFKAIVKIHGAEDQRLYGTKPGTLLVRAIRVLTEHEPGWANLKPESISLFQRDWVRGPWQLLKVVTYDEVPEEQQEWRKAEQKGKT